MKSNLVFFLSLSASLLLSSCGATFMTQSKAVVDAKKSYSKILVISRGKNEIARSLLEQDIAKELKGHGVNAVAYHKQSGIGVPVDVELTEQQIEALKQKVIDDGYDGAIITHLINTEEYKELIPSGVYPSTDPNFYGQWGYYWTYYPVYDIAPGTAVTGTRFELESALYDIRSTGGNSLQWLGRFKLEDPDDIQQATAQYAKEVVGAMMEKSISSR
jgi:ribosomal protein S6E (S10)